MNPNPPSAGPAWTERYEQLRSEALSGRSNARGLALFVRRGLAGWMAAWEQMIPGLPARPALACLPTISTPFTDLRGRLAEGLASMILRIRQKERA